MTATADAAAVPAPRVRERAAGAGAGTEAGTEAGAAGRLRALDGLRLLAALMVAGYHYGGRGGQIADAWGASPRQLFPAAAPWLAYGCLGVQIFFVISGFVICLSAQGRSVRAFAASRAARLYPAYWVALVLVAVAARAVPPSDFLVNLTMLQQPLGAERVLGVCWTLWAELRFYVLFALCVVLPGGGRRRTLLFCAGWMLAAVLADAADPGGKGFLAQALMPQYAPFFIGGIGLYLVHRDPRDRPAWAVALAGWLLGQHCAVAGLWHAPDPRFFSYRSAVVIIAVVTAGFAAVALVALGRLGGRAGGRAGWPEGRWLTLAGALTYPFYLVHEHLGWVVIAALHRRAGLPPAAVFALTVAAILALAWAVHRGVERPLGPRLRRALG
ncbi:acyltransferase family protein [Streptomyces sp. NRRL S-244]|uniref:acyltransferase family protein n=1 Tax=Streptomyces sp. NRRL S-244 TaxID=1463897 RepID=UPI0004BF916B|nr:acyltransferase [Streptomyces sp. NRRL S-244]